LKRKKTGGRFDGVGEKRKNQRNGISVQGGFELHEKVQCLWGVPTRGGKQRKKEKANTAMEKKREREGVVKRADNKRGGAGGGRDSKTSRGGGKKG